MSRQILICFLNTIKSLILALLIRKVVISFGSLELEHN